MAGSSSSVLPPSSHNESSFSLLSRRGSDAYGSRYFLVDDSGIHLSSFAIAVLVSSVSAVGILLISFLVTLSILLGSCNAQPLALGSQSPCHSFAINAEVNNLRGWTVPSECERFVADYVDGRQYLLDFAGAIDAARQYLNGLDLVPDGFDIVVLDIDETTLSNLPYYRRHHYGAERFDEQLWDLWVYEAAAPALKPTLKLYKELLAANWGVVFITGRAESQRQLTETNLLAQGFRGWTDLIMRSEAEEGLSAVVYKSNRRLTLQRKGYRIWSNLGDQWSDLLGSAPGNRTFKLTNPLYYIS